MHSRLSLTENMVSKINQHLNKVYLQCGSPAKVFAVYLLITFVIMEVIEAHYQHQWLTNDLGRYLVCISLAIILLVKSYWPEKLQVGYAAFFYLCVFFILPFANFLNMYHQPQQPHTVSNLILVIFILLLVTDWSLFLGLMITAFIAAFFIHKIPHFSMSLSICTCYQTFNTLLWTVFTGIFFSRYLSRNRVSKRLHEEINAAQSGGYIAHELRTPLSTIRLYMQSLEKCLPELLQGYQHAKQLATKNFDLSDQQLNRLRCVVRDITTETESAFNIIDIILVKINQKTQINHDHFQSCSLKSMLNQALQRYPFSDEQRALIHWSEDDCQDEYYYGKQDLTIHIIFNLLRNALHHITAHKKGEIYFNFTSDKNYTILQVKDTGPGIEKRYLKKLFCHHFTASNTGIGLGLNFCQTVMKSYKGKITCESVLGEYTLFSLYFPKLPSAARD